MNDAIWNGEDRRKSTAQPPDGGQTDKEFWRYMASQFETLNVKMNAMHIDMVGHKADMASLQIDVEHVHRDVEAIKRGFPKDDSGERDFDGHHNHHEGLIRSSKKWGDIGTDVLKKLFGGAAWVTVCFVAYAVFEAIRGKLLK